MTNLSGVGNTAEARSSRRRTEIERLRDELAAARGYRNGYRDVKSCLQACILRMTEEEAASRGTAEVQAWRHTITQIDTWIDEHTRNIKALVSMLEAKANHAHNQRIADGVRIASPANEMTDTAHQLAAFAKEFQADVAASNRDEDMDIPSWLL